MRTKIQLFDIDKLNIYWTDKMQSKIFFDKKDTSYSQQLLDLERQILLHPRNIQHLLMPLTNNIFVTDLYEEEFVANKFIARNSDTFISILNPMTNIKKAIIFVKGKFAVGIGAKGITFHTLNQLTTNQSSVQSEFILNIDDTLNPKYLSTKLRFKNLPNQGRYFGNYVDSEGNLISEIMSQLLTMYVDGVKEPYAVLMNITMQTANVVDYLIKAGLSAKQITFFLSQPLIKEYLLLQKGNEALFMKNAKRQVGKKLKSRELNKIELLEKLLEGRYKIENRFAEDPSATLGFIEIPSDWQIDNLKESLVPVGEKPDYSNKEYLTNQMYMLQHFLQIQQMSKAYGNFTQTQDSDTRGFADIQDIIKDRNTRNVVYNENMVSPETIDLFDRSSVVSPFYRYGRRYYETLFDPFYRFSKNTKFGNTFELIKLRYSKIEKGSKKERVMQTLDNDFILFVLHNSYFQGFDFDRLTKGDSSVAKQVKRLKQDLPDNIFLKGLQPLIAYQKDSLTGESVDNLRFYEKKLDNASTEDLSKAFEEIAEYSEQLYKDIIHLLYFQNGLNIGILNYFSTVPYNDRVTNVIKDIHKTFDSFDYESYLNEFTILFDLNNPTFIPKSRPKMGHPLYKLYDFETGDMVYYHKKSDESKGSSVRLLGNKNMKRYNLGYLDGSNYSIKVEETIVDVDYKEVEPLQLAPSLDTDMVSNIYNQLGSKTQSENVIIKPVYQQEGINYAKSINGVFSLRLNNSDKHFGNPFSSDKNLVQKDNLIQTNSTRESVEKYIDWVINSNEERAKWIREQLKSGTLKNKPIVYYKELGEPSHATALDYLINKYNWNNKPNQKGIDKTLDNC